MLLLLLLFFLLLLLFLSCFQLLQKLGRVVVRVVGVGLEVTAKARLGEHRRRGLLQQQGAGCLHLFQRVVVVGVSSTLSLLFASLEKRLLNLLLVGG